MSGKWEVGSGKWEVWSGARWNVFSKALAFVRFCVKAGDRIDGCGKYLANQLPKNINHLNMQHNKKSHAMTLAAFPITLR